jgi:hypothetical protein
MLAAALQLLSIPRNVAALSRKGICYGGDSKAFKKVVGKYCYFLFMVKITKFA